MSLNPSFNMNEWNHCSGLSEDAPISFSSSSTASGSYTPPSGRSTPSSQTHSMDFDPVMMAHLQGMHFINCASPSSVALQNFALGLKSDPSLPFFTDGLPPTSARYNLGDFSLFSPSHGLPLTPSRRIDANFVIEGLACPPRTYMPSPGTSVRSASFCQVSPMWPEPSSPLGGIFYVQEPPTYDQPTKLESESPPSQVPIRLTRRQAMVSKTKQVRRRTTAMRETQLLPQDIPVARTGRFKCEVPVCNKRFQRKEHWKRHTKTKHNANPIEFVCPSCFKPCDRLDNLRQHIQRHTKERGKVHYDPEAMFHLTQLDKGMRKRTCEPKHRSESGS